MLGLFFLTGSEETIARGRALVQSNSTRRHWQTEHRLQADFFVGVVSIRGGCIWESGDGRYLCAVDGWIGSTRVDRKDALPAFARAIAEAGPDAALQFHGEFTAVVIDTEARRCIIVNDRFGKRTAYLHPTADGVHLTPDIDGLVTNGLLTPSLNKSYIVSLLRLNKIRPGTSTLFDGVEVLKPGSWIEVDLSGHRRVKRSLYYRHRLTPEEPLSADWESRFIACMQSAINRSMDQADGPVALTLSGGLDSRFLLAATPPERRRELIIVSYGMEDSLEARIAGQVAALAGKEISNIPIGPEDYICRAAAATAKNEEYDIFVQGAQSLTTEQLARHCNYVMSGWDLDVPLRGIYLDDDVLSMDDVSQVADMIFRKWELFSRQELRRLLKQEFFDQYIDSADDMVRQGLEEMPENMPVKKYLGFICRFEKQRLLMLRSRFIRHDLETLTPFYDDELQTMLSTVPEESRARNRLFQRIFSRLAPEMLAITYQRTNMPGDVHPGYWTEGTELETRRERLYRRIYQESGRLVEYKRYYSNFAQWLLSDTGWRQFVDDLFFNGDAVLFEEIADRSYVRQLIERDRRSEISEFSKIVHLVSLELYLRRYFT